MIRKTSRVIDTKLLIILAVSVLLRIGVAILLGNRVVPLPGTSDQVSYHNLALRLVDGYGFSFDENWWPFTTANAPTAHWSYLYTLYLAGVYTLFGPVAIAARLIQAVLVGLLQPYLAYKLAQQIFLEPITARYKPNVGEGLPDVQAELGRRGWIPLLAAGITGIYAYFVYYAATLMTEAFFIVALLGSLNLFLAITSRSRGARVRSLALGLGILLGVTVLLRQVFLLIIPFLMMWLIVIEYRNGRSWTSVGATVAVAAVCVMLMILPFSVYNYVRFHQVVLLNTNAGYALYLANHPSYGTTWIDASEMGKSYVNLVPDELRQLDEAALDKELRKRAFAFIWDDPLRYVRLSLSRVPAYFKFWPDSDSGLVSNIARAASFGLFLPFMVYGLLRPWFSSKPSLLKDRWRWPAPAALLLYMFILVYSGLHVFTWTQIRYRMPVDSVLVLFAALPFAELLQVARRPIAQIQVHHRQSNIGAAAKPAAAPIHHRNRNS